MEILYLCGREPGYSRNSIIIKGLRKNKVNLILCTSSSKYAFIRYIVVLLKFFLKKHKKHDAVFIGFFGQPLVLIIRLFTKKPIIFDAYMSAYDTIVLDKKKTRKSSVLAKFLYFLDKKSCQLADIILLDTNSHIYYFMEEFDIPLKKFKRIFIGADDDIFHPAREEKKGKEYIVEFHGNFIPLQGVDCIVKAAKILDKYEDIRFEIIGNGQTFNNNFHLARKLNLKNIRFHGRKKQEEISRIIARASIGLGIFGDTEKAKRVIPNKAYEVIAMKKALITIGSPAARELFTDKKDIVLCRRSPKSLADAILLLKDNNRLRERIANNAYNLFKRKCTPEVIGREISQHIKEIISA